jgi:hypothetical protein
LPIEQTDLLLASVFYIKASIVKMVVVVVVTEMTESVARSRKAAATNRAHFEAWFVLIFRDITIRKVCERLIPWLCDSGSTYMEV